MKTKIAIISIVFILAIASAYFSSKTNYTAPVGVDILTTIPLIEVIPADSIAIDSNLVDPTIETKNNFNPDTVVPVFQEVARDTDKTINTTVDFVFNINGQQVKETLQIPHFDPTSEADIQLGIHNRYISEERSLLNAQ